MTHRPHSFFPISLFIFGLISILTLRATPASDRPNVVVIYTDDHRFTGVHALGGQAVHTPNLDQLAYEGIVFRRAYLMGAFAGATCIPSRNALLTGKHVFEMEQPGRNVPTAHTTIGEAFHAAGYSTYAIGKWHQDPASLARSFDGGATHMGLSAYLVDHYRMPLWDWDPAGKYLKKDAYLLEYDATGQMIRRPLADTDQRGPTGTEHTGPHTSEIFADSAISFIESYHKPQPYFMYLAFHAPHDPRQAPDAYKALYPENEVALTPSYLPEHPFDNGHIKLRDEMLAPWPRTPPVARKELSDYYAAITHLDAQIGRVIASLKANGTYENTLIVMAGDSGLAVGNHGLMGKQNVYDEDGVHIPLIFAGGALTSHSAHSDAFAYIQDIFPTLCDLAGVPIPASVSGRSLADVIHGQTDQVRDHTYHAYLHYQRAYRKGDYKLIEYVRAPGEDKAEYGDAVRGSRVTQLFNYRTDPWETHNLAMFPEYADRVAAMRADLRQAATDYGDLGAKLINYDYDFWAYY